MSHHLINGKGLLCGCSSTLSRFSKIVKAKRLSGRRGRRPCLVFLLLEQQQAKKEGEYRFGGVRRGGTCLALFKSQVRGDLSGA